MGPNEMRSTRSATSPCGTSHYLGGDVKITYSGGSIAELSLSSKTYVKQICNKIEMLMGWKLK
eukprot:15077197-Ditylum_brightwellii.AAC.1